MRKNSRIHSVDWKQIKPIEQDGKWWVFAEDLMWQLDIDSNRLVPQFKTRHRETGKTLISEEGFYQALLVSNEAEAFQKWFFYFFRDKMMITFLIREARMAMGFKPLEVLEFVERVSNE